MNKKVLYIVVAVIFIIALILTMTVGLRVGLGYAEGNEITFSINKNVEPKDIGKIANEIWKKSEVQKIEFFGDRVLIKVGEVKDEELDILCEKVNEKYETELKKENISINHIANIKLSSIIEPYIVPALLSTLLIAGYYAIRFKDVKKMINLLKYLVIAEGLLYSAYAILRVPVNELTMPIAMTLYTLVVLINTVKEEV